MNCIHAAFMVGTTYDAPKQNFVPRNSFKLPDFVVIVKLKQIRLKFII